MRKLSFIVLLVISFAYAFAQSPHGDGFKLDCAICHSPESWEFLRDSIDFDHSQTGFSLNGLHQFVDCIGCHTNLKFSATKRECKDCHTDMHNNTLGPDCDRCHTPKTWIVQNTTEMHQLSRFPLLGAHTVADCFDCHQSETNLKFEPLGVECVDCHQSDYLATTAPNHQQSGYSTNCTGCHSARSIGWTSANFEHSFFPLNKGHAISCAECHLSGTFEKISNECISCHQRDYNTAQTPNHQQLNFSVNCVECHTIDPVWEPAEFNQHDSQFFPIYSGSHNNEWSSCTDCHTNQQSYAEFSCTGCHEHNQSEMDNEHRGINGYSYISSSCFSCHPVGNQSGAFNHSNTGFPLTGAHISADCISCHTNGYSGLSSQCVDCHTPDFNNSTNPNHITSGFPTTCETCHSTAAWQPSNFNHNATGFALTGAHIPISCAACHDGNYTSTPNVCYACHTADYNNTTDPNHAGTGFPTECESCHSTNAWQPSTYNHDSQYFPIYSGRHQGTWNSCTDCHTITGNYAVFSCIDCHEHNRTDTDSHHQGVNNYSYNSVSCLTCHPQGRGD